MSYSKNPIPHPKKCGNCALVGFDCDCDCHKSAITAGYHEKIITWPFEGDVLGSVKLWKIRHFIVTKLKLKVARI